CGIPFDDCPTVFGSTSNIQNESRRTRDIWALKDSRSITQGLRLFIFEKLPRPIGSLSQRSISPVRTCRDHSSIEYKASDFGNKRNGRTRKDLEIADLFRAGKFFGILINAGFKDLSLSGLHKDRTGLFPGL